MHGTRDAAPTRVEAVMTSIEGRISSRRLVPGARLPSVRECAAALGVSKSTVVDAYERLVAAGAIAARRGSGFYVAGATRPLSLKALGPELDRALDPLWLTRQSLQAGPDTLKPGSGWLPSSWMPDESLQRALRQLARGDIVRRTQYDEPQGYAPLRQHLAHRLGERGVAVPADGLILTDSGSQSLDLLFRFLLEAGDTVLVDDPCYFNFHALLRAHRANVIGLPYTPDGVDTTALAAALAEHRPRFYLTNAGPQNPTGAKLTPANAHRVLSLLERHDVLCIEDDVFADVERTPSVRLAGLGGLERVIQIGSYTKTVSAACRCGFIAVAPRWIEELVGLKLATYLGNSRMGAALLHALLTDGGYRRHLDGLHTKLSHARGVALTQLGALGLEPFIEPQDGVFVWARLPGGLDAAAVARRALLEDVIFAPGNVFSVSHGATSFMRFNVARCSHPKALAVLARAMDACAGRGSIAAE